MSNVSTSLPCTETLQNKMLLFEKSNAQVTFVGLFVGSKWDYLSIYYQKIMPEPYDLSN